MKKILTVSALLGFAALAAGAGLLAGFSGGPSEVSASSPKLASNSLRPATGPEIVQPIPLCTGAVPSALRVERFNKAPISSDTSVDSASEPAEASSLRDITGVAEVSSQTVASQVVADSVSESSEAGSLSEASVVSETTSATDSSFGGVPASTGSRRLPTLTSSVNPGALGNSFTHNGQRVSVADVSHSASGEVAGIDFQSAPESSAAARNQQQAPAGKTSVNRQKKSSKSPYKTGLTYEEELFRTKWGWDAFAQAQSLGNNQ